MAVQKHAVAMEWRGRPVHRVTLLSESVASGAALTLLAGISGVGLKLLAAAWSSDITVHWGYLGRETSPFRPAVQFRFDGPYGICFPFNPMGWGFDAGSGNGFQLRNSGATAVIHGSFLIGEVEPTA